MTVWRPKQHVAVKVIGLVRRGASLLAAEVEGDDGRVKGVRPLGGTVEFGETRERALEREFFEELGTGIRVLGPWFAFENIFAHEGDIGHEIIFAAGIELADRSLYARDKIVFTESDGARGGALVRPRPAGERGHGALSAGLDRPAARGASGDGGAVLALTGRCSNGQGLSGGQDLA